MTETPKKKEPFKILKKMPVLTIDQNSYYVSTQVITSDNGNESTHVVIKKQAFNEDGSPRGNSKQLFIPESHTEKVLTAVLGYVRGK